MFPLQQGNELVIQFSNIPHQQGEISQDLDANDSHKIFTNNNINRRNSKKVLLYGYDEENQGGGSSSNNHHKEKKMVHREIERLRRQEMATLYASLRSQLPLEFIKGKRSISDHMNEAGNYIKHMQKNIKELGTKRDELKKLSNNINSKLENHDESKPISGSFTVHESNGVVGIEIIEEGLTLSKLMQLMVEEELEVVSYLSTKVNGRLVHSVQCEVDNPNGVDLSELRRKLANLIPSFRCSD